jgi:hypothetical protein
MDFLLTAESNIDKATFKVSSASSELVTGSTILFITPLK